MELTSRISLTYAKTKRCFLSPYSTMYSLSYYVSFICCRFIGDVWQEHQGPKIPSSLSRA